MNYRYYFLLSALLVVASCTDAYDSGGIGESGKGDGTMNSLRVSDAFDWSMNRNVTVSIASEVDADLSLYRAKSGSDSDKLAEMRLEAGASRSFLFSIERHCSTLYLKYGGQVVSLPVVDGRADYRIAAGTANTVRLGSDGSGDGSAGGDTYYYPSAAGYATLFFEDLYPSAGDYDFNDYVAKYKAVARWNASKRQYDGLRIDYTVCARGGSVAMAPYLLLRGISTDNVQSVKWYGGEYEGADRTDAIKSMEEGMSTLFTLPDTGERYFNTRPDRLSNDLIEYRLEIVFQNVSRFDLSPDFFDFFLVKAGENNGLQEIHRKGWKPVFYRNGEVYYDRSNGLVWALQVPDDVRWASEETDFLKAYPQFGAWAQSGGRVNPEWYKHPVTGSVITLPEK